MRKALIGGAALCLLADCTSQTHTVSPASTAVSVVAHSSASTTAPPPQPATWSTAVAAAKYTALVGPPNAAVKRFLDDNSTSVSYPQAAQEAAAVAAAYDAFARGLISGRWPVNAASTAEKLADQVLAARVYWSAMGTMTTAADIQSASNDPGFVSVENSSSGTATRLRILLGLPSNG